ncbi:flippase-like domain-containing protein, partial [Candidatus Saccharibacteria bacterium]|nr:flippase-like domain-containing protein [Candidatus Saccharibacteria bacterium]
YIFRYAITTVINYLQAFVAMLVLIVLHAVPAGAEWIMIIAVLMNFGVFIALLLIVFVASNKKRISFFARVITRITNAVGKIFTFGRKKRVLNDEKIGHYLDDIHESVLIARRDKKSLVGPTVWGVVYSLFEVGTYWIVAIALGRPELLGAIMVGEAIGSVFDGIVPYGLYELGMAGVMIALGVDFPTATIITVMTRVITLVFTILSGTIPYYKTIAKKKNV